MDFVRLSISDGIAEVRLTRGKVNALNEQLVGEIAACFQELGADPATRAVILTGEGSFFSFGFDIPEFLSGCMLALACDYRVMASGKAKISLNEITFGSSVFAGSVAMLKFLVGGKNAQAVLYDGTMYSAEASSALGLIDQASSSQKLLEDAREVARHLAAKDAAAFRTMKALLRAQVAAEMVKQEAASIHEFVDIWYSENTWRNLHAITIWS